MELHLEIREEMTVIEIQADIDNSMRNAPDKFYGRTRSTSAIESLESFRDF